MLVLSQIGILNEKIKALEIKLFHKIAGGFWVLVIFFFPTDIFKSRQMLSSMSIGTRGENADL